MAMAEKIRIVLVKRNISAVELARRLKCSSANIYSKLKRDNFSEKELAEIADMLNCSYTGHFTMLDTGEQI